MNPTGFITKNHPSRGGVNDRPMERQPQDHVLIRSRTMPCMRPEAVLLPLSAMLAREQARPAASSRHRAARRAELAAQPLVVTARARECSDESSLGLTQEDGGFR